MDNLLIYGPGGASSLNVGSWLEAAKGADFGSRDLQKAIYAENPDSVLPRLGLESLGVRRMSFPLLLASHAAGGSVGISNLIRSLARPGAVFDVQLDGMASADAVRFDVLAGRLEDDYDLAAWRGGRRLSHLLRLDTQPLGYLPTTILLASAASVGLPGTLSVPAGSVLGDYPGLAELIVQPTTATNYPAGTWLSDFVAWGMGAKASFSAFFPAASVELASVVASLVGDQFAPGSQALELAPVTGSGWQRSLFLPITEALEPAYRGRHRAFAWMRLTPSQALPWYSSLDSVMFDLRHTQALGSAAPVATVPPAVASGTPGGFGAQPSPAYTLVDLGEVSPYVASGQVGGMRVRLWLSAASSAGGVATPYVRVGGVYLLPLDGGAGILPRGLVAPTIGEPGGALEQGGRLSLDAITGNALVKRLSATQVNLDARRHYVGELPRIGASVLQVDLLAGARKVASGATGPVVHSAPMFAQAALYYRPRFLFLKGV